MPAPPLTDLSRCAIHTLTNKPWSLRQCIDGYRKAGITGISVWRNALADIGAAEAGRMLRSAGMRVPALVRGGFFSALDAEGRQKALNDNRICIDEAAAIGAEMVCSCRARCRVCRWPKPANTWPRESPPCCRMPSRRK